MKTVAVVGGGPSGIMASIALASNKNCNVILFEKTNRLGKKLSITGGGRCNITSCIPMEDFYEKIPRGNKFLFSSFSTFTNYDLLNFFKPYNLNFKKEQDKFYPVSDSADDVLKALKLALKKEHVQVHCNEQLLEISLKDYNPENPKDKHINSVYSIVTNQGNYIVDSLIICCGGLSYPATGSDGNLFPVLKKLNVKLTNFYPSLVQIHSEENTSDIMGISLDKVHVYAKVGKKKFQTEGSMIFTNSGFSGPSIMNISSFITEFDPVDIEFNIDFLPDISVDKLENMLFSVNKKFLSNIIGGEILPLRLAKYLLEDYDHLDKNNLSKKEKAQIIENIKFHKFNIRKFGSIKESVVTRGGVDLKDVNASTLEHKKIKGLYFAGECLDIDALTGGYNLQIAFSTGYLAGKSVANSI